MQKNKILTKKILYIFFIIIIPLILGTNFVKKYNISSDHNQRLAMALNYKLSGRISLSTNLSKSNEEYSILRSPLYSIIVSLVIPKITFENIKSYECYQKSQTEECYSVLRNIQIFNLATFVSIILMTFFLINHILN